MMKVLKEETCDITFRIMIKYLFVFEYTIKHIISTIAMIYILWECVNELNTLVLVNFKVLNMRRWTMNISVIKLNNIWCKSNATRCWSVFFSERRVLRENFFYQNVELFLLFRIMYNLFSYDVHTVCPKSLFLKVFSYTFAIWFNFIDLFFFKW